METVDVAVVSTHVAPAKGYGGIAECVGRVAQAWAQDGRRFRLCASDASEGAPLTPADLGLPPGVTVELYATRRWLRFGFGLGAVPALLRACRGARVVYVNGLGTWPVTLAAIICAVLGRPMVVALHAGLMRPHVAIIRARKPHKWAFYRLLTLPALRRAAALHLTSTLEEDGLDTWAPGLPRVIVPNGLDLGEWPVLPPRAPDGGLTLCYVGRFSPEKGILRFLRAWRRARGPGDRLLLAGSGEGAYADAVAAEAAACGGAVESLGYLDRAGVQAVLARADMLVLPSGIEDGDLRENFGNVVVEAMAAARPVLVARGLAWDRVEDEGAGLVFDGNEDGIAAALQRAAALPPAERAAMGTRGRAWAERSFDIRRTAEDLWDLMQCCAAGLPPHRR